ncbi:mechanosensitive ion channel family protein [Eubacteriales bacterium OttesenSCG-928-M02]|nr:mechanosensitive ion channel family protein [Eubacteriales bacterium OttesenSCG-928-M02]
MERIVKIIEAWFDGDILHGLSAMAITAVAGLLLWLILRRIFSRIEKRLLQEGKRSNISFYRAVVKGLIIGFTIVGILYQVKPLRSMLTSLLAGSGIAAVFVGLASQQAFGNLISGIFISTYNPFFVGQRIKLVEKGITGIVEDISLFYTRIRTFDNTLVVVPNSVVDKAIIENVSAAEDGYCNFFEIAIDDKSDVEKARELIAQLAEKHESFLDRRTAEDKAAGKPAVNVLVAGIEKNMVRLRAGIWTPTVGDGFALLSDMRREVKAAFDEAGINLYRDAVDVTLNQE